METPHLFGKWKITSFFSKLKMTFNILANGRPPTFWKMKDDLNFWNMDEDAKKFYKTVHKNELPTCPLGQIETAKLNMHPNLYQNLSKIVAFLL